MYRERHDSPSLAMNLFPSFRVRRDTLALGLCLLAALFALEAKIAWYGPTAGPEVDISRRKALPADLPSVVSHQSPSQPLTVETGVLQYRLSHKTEPRAETKAQWNLIRAGTIRYAVFLQQKPGWSVRELLRSTDVSSDRSPGLPTGVPKGCVRQPS